MKLESNVIHKSKYARSSNIKQCLLASVMIHEVLLWKLYDYSALDDAFILMRNGV